MSDNLSQKIMYIISELEEVKKITNDNKNIFDNYIKQQNNESHINILSTQAAEKFNGNISPAQLIENIVDGYISAGSYFGNIGLLACVFSYKKTVLSLQMKLILIFEIFLCIYYCFYCFRNSFNSF